MFLLHSQPAHVMTVSLRPPALRWLLLESTALALRLRDVWRRGTERRAARHHARVQAALIRTLDAHVLRDIGLGEFAASNHDDADYRRELDLRGF